MFLRTTSTPIVPSWSRMASVLWLRFDNEKDALDLRAVIAEERKHCFLDDVFLRLIAAERMRPDTTNGCIKLQRQLLVLVKVVVQCPLAWGIQFLRHIVGLTGLNVFGDFRHALQELCIVDTHRLQVREYLTQKH